MCKNLRWEFIKENKKVTKKRKKVFLLIVRFLGRECVFLPFFLTVIVFSWSLSWSRACFLSLFLDCYRFFLITFLVENVFSCFLTFLFSFLNSHLCTYRHTQIIHGRLGVCESLLQNQYICRFPRSWHILYFVLLMKYNFISWNTGWVYSNEVLYNVLLNVKSL